MTAARYFTLDEANRLVPHLEARFGRAVQLRTQMRSLYEQLDAQGAAPTAQTLLSDEGPPEIVSLRVRLRGLIELLTEELQAVEALGVSVKDVDTGLCDFLGRREGRDVWLCWKLGEKAVGFWHELDAGFAGRQPLEGLGAAMLH